MIKLALALLLTTPTAYAHHIPEAQDLTGSEICAALEDELDHAINHGIITESEATKLIIRCYVNYG